MAFFTSTEPLRAKKQSNSFGTNTIVSIRTIVPGDLMLNVSVGGAAAGGGGGHTYTVVSGDNLTKIGAKYGLTWQQVFDANKDIISDPDKIFPGQELKIPGA